MSLELVTKIINRSNTKIMSQIINRIFAQLDTELKKQETKPNWKTIPAYYKLKYKLDIKLKERFNKQYSKALRKSRQRAKSMKQTRTRPIKDWHNAKTALRQIKYSRKQVLQAAQELPISKIKIIVTQCINTITYNTPDSLIDIGTDPHWNWMLGTVKQNIDFMQLADTLTDTVGYSKLFRPIDAIYALAKRVAPQMTTNTETIQDFCKWYTKNRLSLFTDLNPLPTLEKDNEELKKQLKKTGKMNTYQMMWRAIVQHKDDEEWQNYNTYEYQINPFVKKEFYEESKLPRFIYNRSNQFRALTKVSFNALQELAMSLPQYKSHNIKHFNMSKMHQYLYHKYFEGQYQYIYMSDYTGYEGTIIPTIEKTVTSWYLPVLANNPLTRHIYEQCVKPARNMTLRIPLEGEVNSRTLKISTIGGRMSGDAWTSLNNTIYNIEAQLYNLQRQGIDPETVFFLCEGDDMIMFSHVPVTPKFLIELGLKPKWTQATLETAKFCSIGIYDGNFSLPSLKQLTKLGYTAANMVMTNPKIAPWYYTVTLLGLSTLHPRCPILTAVTKYHVKHCGATLKKLREELQLTWSDREMTVDFPTLDPPTQQARLQFYKEYGIPIHEQLLAEDYYTQHGHYSQHFKEILPIPQYNADTFLERLSSTSASYSCSRYPTYQLNSDFLQ